MKTIAEKIMLLNRTDRWKEILADKKAQKVDRKFDRTVLHFKDGSKLCFYPKKSQYEQSLLTYWCEA